ncbi:MAG: hypothetical protein ACRCWJ_19440, partial [Casimicrobium sp.]
FAEKLSQAVSESPVAVRGLRIQVNLRIGVVSARGGEGIKLSALREAATEALKEAKQNGKACVIAQPYAAGR